MRAARTLLLLAGMTTALAVSSLGSLASFAVASGHRRVAECSLADATILIAAGTGLVLSSRRALVRSR